MPQNLAKSVEELLKETGELHHQAFIETDGADDEWPLWYAKNLQAQLNEMLSSSFTKSELIYHILSAENQRATKSPDEAWPSYYSRYFVDLGR